MDCIRGIHTEDHVNKFRKILVGRELLLPSQDNHVTMLRFLQAKNYNYGKATQYWKEMIEWRIENGVDTIVEDFEYKEYEDAQVWFPLGFHGVDKEGRPVYIQRRDKLDYSRLMNVTTMDRFIKSYIQTYEKLLLHKFPACSKNANRPIHSVVMIIVFPRPRTRTRDGSDLLFKRMKSIRLSYYPHIEHQFFVLSSVRTMSLLVRPLLWYDKFEKRGIHVRTPFNTRTPFTITPPHTQCMHPSIIYIIWLLFAQLWGQDLHHKLLEFIDIDQLPTFLGGTCTCRGQGGCLRFAKGPWQLPKTSMQPAVANAANDDEMQSAAANDDDEPPSYFICPILKEPMKDPHVAADGFTYEAEAMRKWVKKGHNTSPMTNKRLPNLDLIPNHALRSAINEWRHHHHTTVD